MVVNGIQAITVGLDYCNNALLMLLAKIPFDWMMFFLQVKETDLWGDVQRAWGHFVKTGQLWAFLIGLFVGYGIKAFTSFG
jgi:hypothetical protein